MTAKLYCFGESGNAYKVALALTFADMEWEPVFVDFFNGDTRTPEFRAINEMGEVPVLVDGETTLTQSGVILDYISSQIRQAGRPVSGRAARGVALAVLGQSQAVHQIGTARFLANFLPADKRPEGVVPFLQGRLKAAYTVLNNHLRIPQMGGG